MSYFRILSFDGGGIRGVLSIELLNRLCNKHPDLLKNTNLLAGTSAGSLIALGLAAGKSPRELCQLISQEVYSIFSDPKIGGPITTTKYSNRELKRFLKEVFDPELRLKDLGKHVIIPTFALSDNRTDCWQPIALNNFDNSPYLETKVIDAALASSAAPSYFPSYKGCIDGGVVANNPCALAISLAVSHTGRPLNGLSALSIGTGFFPFNIKENTNQWGIISNANNTPLLSPSWGLVPKPREDEPRSPLLSIIMDGTAMLNDSISKDLLADNYFRINPVLPYPVELDDVGALSDLVTLANQTNLDDASIFISRVF